MTSSDIESTMSLSPQPSLEQAEAQLSQLRRKHDSKRKKFHTAINDHETHFNFLKHTLEENQESIISDFETALVNSFDDRHKIELELQEEKQRLVDLTKKLEKTKDNTATVELASEKINHGLTKNALDKSKSELEKAKREIVGLRVESEVAHQQYMDLQMEYAALKLAKTRMDKEHSTTLSTINQRKDYVEAELELTKGKSADLQQRLNSAEQQHADLKADLEAATTRASGAEDELKTFKSRFQQITNLISPPSSGQQPVVAEVVSPAPAPNTQCNVEQRGSGPQTNDSLACPQSLDPQANNASSSQYVPGHAPSETARSTPDANGKKRKAGNDTLALTEDVHAQKRRSRAPTEQSSGHPQPVNSSPGRSLSSAQSSSSQPRGNSHRPTQASARSVVRQLSTDIAIGLNAKLSTVAELVSFIKSPSTITGSWESLVPNEFELIDYACRTNVEERISMLVQRRSRDVIVLRLTPADEADRPKFHRVFEHFVEKKKNARVCHIGAKDVEDIYLIPTSTERDDCYPTFFTTLNFGLLPPKKTENVLFMAVVFKVAGDKQKLVRQTWDKRMMAIQNGDAGSLTNMRFVLAQNPLHIFSARMTVVSAAKPHLDVIGTPPYSSKITSPELHKYGQNLLRLSYSRFLEDLPRTGGVSAPEWVFVLGGLVMRNAPKAKAIIVIDIQQEDRPLWLISQFGKGWNLALLASKFPGCLKEWEDVIPSSGGLPNQGENMLKGTGLTMERPRRLRRMLQLSSPKVQIGIDWCGM